jgi:glycosyltransferase involved in cell wall biosynthesis
VSRPRGSEAASGPLISVVVPTRDRPERLARLLEGLRGQSLDRARFEVVVVDDGSGPSTAAVLARARTRASELTIRVERHPRARGPAAARNTGWRAAAAQLIAFTDDDCLPAPDWLRSALGACAAHPGAIVQGRTLPDPDEWPGQRLMARVIVVDRPGAQYASCNIVYPRELLARLGGFDESYGPGPTAEDTDLAWRAIEAGHRTAFASDVLVFHAVERIGVRGMLRSAGRWGGAVRVFADHPQTRTMLYRHRWWNVWHYLLWRSLLSLAGPAWLRRLLVARHLAQLHRRARDGAAHGADWAWAIPFLLAYDTVECVAVARGAVRHRVRVL